MNGSIGTVTLNRSSNYNQIDIIRVFGEFDVEHLSTFTTPANRQPPDAEISLRKLRTLYAKSLLRVTRCLITLQQHGPRRDLIVSDQKTGFVLERLYIPAILSPIYRVSNDSEEPFNNLLMFAVSANSLPEGGPECNEFHMFQCLSCPSHFIVEDIIQEQTHNSSALRGVTPLTTATRLQRAPYSGTSTWKGPPPSMPIQSVTGGSVSSLFNLPSAAITSSVTNVSPHYEQSGTQSSRGARSPSPQNSPPTRPQTPPKQQSYITTMSKASDQEALNPRRNGFNNGAETRSITPIRSYSPAVILPLKATTVPVSEIIQESHSNRSQSPNLDSYYPEERQPPGAIKMWIEKEIDLLNLSFDDIESCIAELQRTPAKTRSVSMNSLHGNISVSCKKEKKRLPLLGKNPKKGKKKEAASRPTTPDSLNQVNQITSPMEFSDCFSKFKFALLLLSRLQGYVTEPNAPVLTRKLFTLLHIPVDRVRDPITGRPEIARQTVNPLFTQETIDMIRSSLSSGDERLWNELGDAWKEPRERWRTDEPVFIPRFKNGYIPNPEQYDPSLFRYKENIPQNGIYTAPLTDAIQINDSTVDAYNEKNKGTSNNQQAFLTQLVQRGARIVQANRNREGANNRELTVVSGEYLELLDDSRNWHEVRNIQGKTGYCPYTILNNVEVTMNNSHDDPNNMSYEIHGRERGF